MDDTDSYPAVDPRSHDVSVSETSLPTPSPAQCITHDPHRRVTDILQRLAPGKMRIGFFVGAGCPLSIRVVDGEGTKPLIPEIHGLTAKVKEYLLSDNDLKDHTNTIWSRVIGRGIARPTIEDILSHIRTLKSISGVDGIDGFSDKSLSKLDSVICEHIRDIVDVPLPTNDTPYHVLASWIQAIARDKPVEIFTTNYDLLLEQALEERRVPYFDGFIGSDSAFLDLESMAEDDLPARWARLWKMHGSINWWMTEKRSIQRSRDKKQGKQLLIYPSHLKYKQSRQMPYFAMLDRLRVFLRIDQCVLLVCGYSFADEHINAYIGQGLSGNPNASCIAMIYNDRVDVPKAIELAKSHANLTVLAADGGVIGTVDRNWDSTTVKENNPAYPLAVGIDLPTERSKAPSGQCKWLLGDFAALGEFLAYQLSSRDIEQGQPDAP